jgi:hypothetical protein
MQLNPCGARRQAQCHAALACSAYAGPVCQMATTIQIGRTCPLSLSERAGVRGKVSPNGNVMAN